jgi:hypothetical protein
MGSISLLISFAASILFAHKNAQRHAVLSWYMYSGAPPSCNSCYVCTVIRIPIVVRHNKTRLVLLSSGDSFPQLIQKLSSKLRFVTYLLNCPRTSLATCSLSERDGAAWWVVIISCRSVVNVLLSCRLRCASSHLKPKAVLSLASLTQFKLPSFFSRFQCERFQTASVR